MKLIVISDPEKIYDEENLIPQLFDNGLEYYHLRKPAWSKSQVADLLNNIPNQYHSKIIIHGNWDLMNNFNLGGVHIREKDKYLLTMNEHNFHSMAIHKLDELYQISENFNPVLPINGYALLSPIFNSISKKDIKSSFNLDDLKSTFTKNKPKVPVYALGGVNLDNILKATEIGFDGVAVLGFIWNIFKSRGSNETILNLKKLQTLCQ